AKDSRRRRRSVPTWASPMAHKRNCRGGEAGVDPANRFKHAKPLAEERTNRRREDGGLGFITEFGGRKRGKL
ncbi:MAG: hypothetical protein ACK53L_04450, partial [Pirellulaceae bacterium]